MPVHIGEIIKRVMLEKNLSQEKLGKLINKNKQNVGNIFKRKSIDTDLLLKLSEALHYNFFEQYYTEEPLKSMRSEEIEALKKSVEELTTEIGRKNREIADLRRTIDTDNKLIDTNTKLVGRIEEENEKYKQEIGEQKF